MDGFQVRLQLVSILRKLSSSQNSIQSTIRFLLKYKNKYGEDLWDCLIEESEKANLNARINILYLIDALLFTSATALLTTHQDYHSQQQAEPTKASESIQGGTALHNQEFNYGYSIKRDINQLIEIIVPMKFKKNGLLNLMSTQQVLKNWRNQINLIESFLSVEHLNQIDQILLTRKSLLSQAEVDPNGLDNEFLDFSKKDILDRIDDDRERHKRLRERIWVLPIPPISSLSPKLTNAQHPASTYTSHRSATLLHTSLLASNNPTAGGAAHASASQPDQPRHLATPHLETDRTISLECDQLIYANQDDTGSEGLEDSDRLAIKFENSRCFGLPNQFNFHEN